MKQIIENIKNNREDLISKYWEMKHESCTITEKQRKAFKNNDYSELEQHESKFYDLQCKIKNVILAINDLTGALNSLGERTEIFWGD